MTSLQSEEPESSRGAGTGVVVLGALLLLVLAGLGFLAYRLGQRADAVEQQLTALSLRTEEALSVARAAMDRANSAEDSARAAAVARAEAEAEKYRAREESEAARGETEAARREAAAERERAARAQAEADRIRARAEAELNRLQDALGQIAETRRTALGLVMSLGGDHLKFGFDKADLRPEDRELLSRIAGILDVGSDEYNQRLSERRAQAVHDYLVKVGLSPEILSVTGHGKSRPLVPGTSEEARAKNRRVELGIVNTRILYGRESGDASAEAGP
jgi:outer membrane protein OmpA-like peptidoglycan-associated protein